MLPYGHILSGGPAVLSLFAGVIFWFCGCQSSYNSIQGVQEGFIGFVPARTAVASCMIWPRHLNFKNLGPINASSEDIEDICQRVDKFVLESFRNQPYVKGYSPKAVAKLLAKQTPTYSFSGLEAHWKNKEKACESCPNVSSYYLEVVREIREWKLWLGEVSARVKNCDALLVPVLHHAFERARLDRGVRMTERGLGLTVLLISTNDAGLIWSRSRNALANHKFVAKQGDQESKLPKWDSAISRLLSQSLWLDYPGRLTN